VESTIAAPKIEIRLLILLVLVLAIFQGHQSWRNWSDDRAATARRANLEKSLKDLEIERQKVFTDYAAALESYETKSVMHQQYHAANAQMKLQSLALQQEQLLMLINR
jgi:uncharacterized protein YlxW (UPF0749 family)